MIFAAVGTGIGGAVVINGELYHGVSSCSGELGHITVDQSNVRCWEGRTGTLNALASGTALAQQTGYEGEQLSEAWHNKEPAVVSIVEQAAHALGLGLSNAVYVLNPELVVIGGGVASLGEEYLKLVHSAAQSALFSEVSDACSFEFAKAGYEAGVLGAAQMIRQFVMRDSL
jgi:glucokinase